MSTCSYDTQLRINELFKNSTNLITTLVDELNVSLDNLI